MLILLCTKSPQIQRGDNGMRKELTRKDSAPGKRVELHLHTKMSALDGLVDVERLFEVLKTWGHNAVAVTDHGVVHAFPEFAEVAEKVGIKPIFGMEAYMMNDVDPVVFNLKEGDRVIDDIEFVVFDTETTGLNPDSDEILEIAAVKIRGGEKLGEFHSFIKPRKPVDISIRKIVGLTDDEMNEAPGIEESLPRFLEFCEGAVLVGHNAAFEHRFLHRWAQELLGKDWQPTYIDTMALSRFLLESRRRSLREIVSYLDLDVPDHDKGILTVRMTEAIFRELVKLMKKRRIKTIGDVEKLRKITSERKQHPLHHVSILVTNSTGLRNLYKLVSLSHTDYLNKKAIVPKSVLSDMREGLLIGSACISGELSEAYLTGSSETKLKEIAEFYDYIEIMPVDAVEHFESSDDERREELAEMYRVFYRIARRLGIPAVMTGDVHFIELQDSVSRAVIAALYGYDRFDKQPGIYLRTTDEMLEAAMEIFNDEEIAEEVTVINSRSLSDKIEKLDLFSPCFDEREIRDIEAEIKEFTEVDARRYLEERFGEENVFRGGQMITLGSKDAHMSVKNYMDKKGVKLKGAEIQRLSEAVQGTRKAIRGYPGAFVVVPKGRDIHEFTPVQFSPTRSSPDHKITHLPHKALKDALIVVKHI